MDRRIGLTLASLLLAAACAPSPPPPPSLIGHFAGTDGNGTRQTLTFEAGEQAHWTLDSKAASQSFDLRYHLDSSKAPYTLDLLGFTRGPLQGLTLYCLAEPDGADRFRLECEPGLSNPGEDKVRPISFSKRAVLFTRQP